MAEQDKITLDASGWISELQKMTKQSELYNKSVSDLATKLGTYASILDKMSAKSTTLVEGYNESRTALKGHYGAIDAAAKAYGKLISAVEGTTVVLKRQLDSQRDATVVYKQVNGVLTIQSALIESDTKALANNARAIENKNRALREQQSLLHNELSGARGQADSNLLSMDRASLAEIDAAANARISKEKMVEDKVSAISRASAKKRLADKMAAYEAEEAALNRSINNMVKAQAKSAAKLSKAEALNAVKRQLDDVLKHNSNTINRMVLGWETFERVMLLHIARRIFHGVILQMQASMKSVIEFHKAIVEIRTISQHTQASVEAWSASVIKLSNAYGFQLTDVTKAYYESLSNQVSEGVIGTEKFVRTALLFAKVTKSTAEDSVNLLTSAINAYGLSVEDAESLSAKLFKTIDLGRIKASEIANTFGRVLVPAQQLGVSLDEVNTSLAVISIQGVRANESMTWLRNTFVRLNKPGKDLQAMIESWGYSTSQAAIAAEGYFGVLERIMKASSGSTSVITSLFPNIRGAAAIQALIKDYKQLQATQRELVVESDAAYKKSLSYQFMTTGERLEILQQQLANMRTELGSSFFGAVIRATDIFGDFKVNIDGTTSGTLGLTNAVKESIKVFATLVTMLGSQVFYLKIIRPLILDVVKSYQIGLVQSKMWGVTASGAMGMVVDKSKALNSSLKTLAFGLKGVLYSAGYLAVAVAVTEVISYYTRLNRESKELTVNLDELNKTLKENRSQFTTKAVDQATLSLRKYSEALKSLASGRLALSGSVTSTAELKKMEYATKDLQKELSKQLGVFSHDVSTFYTQITKSITDLESKVSDSKTWLMGFTKSIDESIRDLTVNNLSGKDKYKFIDNEISNLYKQLGSTTDAEKQRSIAEQIKNLILERLEAEKQIYEVQKQEYQNRTAEQALNQKEADLQRSRAIDRRQEMLDKKSSKSLGDYEKVRKEQEAIDRARQKLSGKNAIDNNRQDDVIRNKAIKELMELETKLKTVEETRQTEYTKTMEAAKKQQEVILGGLKELLRTTPQLTDAINQLNIVEAEFDPTTFIAGFSSVSDKLSLAAKSASDMSIAFEMAQAKNEAALVTMKSYDDLMQSIVNKKAEEAKLIKETEAAYAEQVAKSQEISKKLIENLTELRKLVGTDWGNFGLSTGSEQEKLGKDLDKLITNYKNAGDLSPEEITKMLKDASEIRQKMLELSKGAGRGVLLPTYDKMGDDMQKIVLAMSLLRKELDQGGLLQQNLKAVYEKVAGENSVVSATQMAQSAMSAYRQSATNDLEQIQRQADLLAATLVDIQSSYGLSPAADYGQTENNYRGKVKYFSKGFVPRGKDTIPAMLSPGESVINSTMTKKLFSHLVPINYGFNSPKNLSNNVSVGDISVNVTGGQTAKQSARAIATEIRKEIQRGTLRL